MSNANEHHLKSAHRSIVEATEKNERKSTVSLMTAKLMVSLVDFEGIPLHIINEMMLSCTDVSASSPRYSWNRSCASCVCVTVLQVTTFFLGLFCWWSIVLDITSANLQLNSKNELPICGIWKIQIGYNPQLQTFSQHCISYQIAETLALSLYIPLTLRCNQFRPNVITNMDETKTKNACQCRIK